MFASSQSPCNDALSQWLNFEDRRLYLSKSQSKLRLRHTAVAFGKSQETLRHIVIDGDRCMEPFDVAMKSSVQSSTDEHTALSERDGSRRLTMDEEKAAPPPVSREFSNESRLLRRILNQAGWQEKDANGESIPLLDSGLKDRNYREASMVRFIRRSFYMKECRQFEENPTTPGRCLTCLGYDFDHKFLPPSPTHTLTADFDEVCAIGTGKRYSVDANKFVCTETNAFGRVEFSQKRNFKNRQAHKFVRLAYDGVENSMRDVNTINNVITLLRRHWRLRQPDLVVSVIGGGERFRISNRRLRAIFNSGLIKALSVTNGWLLTTGSDTGISKAVGDAVREGQSLRMHSGHMTKQIACIGIAAWGNVRHRETITCLEPDKVHHLPTYDYNTVDAGGGIGMVRSQQPKYGSGIDPQGLNPDHTHFLLVDDGRRYKKSGTADFRSVLECKLQETFARTSVVCLCVEGGAHSLSQVYESLTKGTPVLVCEGSGRISDVIAKNYNDSRRQKEKDRTEWFKAIRSDLEELCRERDKIVHETTSEKELDTMCNQIAFICNSPQLSIFKFENRKDLDLALLRCILPAKVTSTDKVKQDEGVKLALSWNRDDIAEEIISQPFYNVEKPDLFHKAILENKVKFVQLFVKNGIAVSRYLTAERLTDLYRKTGKTHLMEVMKIKDLRNITLTDVSNLIKELTGCPARYDKDQLPKHCDPFHELIIYAILFNRSELALYFWNYCQRPLMTALISTWLSDRLVKKFDRKRDESCARDFLEMKQAFESKAIGLLDTADENSTDWAHRLVTASAFSGWSDASCMHIAGAADAKDFLGHECCQREIFNDWNKGFHCNRLKFFIAFFFIFPMFFDYFVRFDEDDKNNSSNSRKNSATDFDDEDTSPSAFELWLMVRERLPLIRQQKWVTNGEEPTVKKPAQIRMPFFHRLWVFYNAPASTFTLHTISYMVYLSLYSYVMLFTYDRYKIGFAEYFLYFWQFNFFAETLYAISQTHGTARWTKVEPWWEQGSLGSLRHLDTVNTVVAFLAFILRLISEATHPFARLLMVINLVIYFQRLFKAFFADSYLGPKVIMIWKMTKELLMFCLFFFVFMLSYSVASQSLIHAEREPFLGVLWHLFAHGLWEIFGEPSDDAKGGIVEGCNNYTGAEWVSSSHAVDCFLRTKPLPIFLTVYLFFTSILLVNMLIAVFSHIFDTVEENAQQLWKFQMYFLVREYAVKSVLPPPFVILYHIYVGICTIIKRFRQPAEPEQPQNDFKFLRMIENVCRSEYVDNQLEQEYQKNHFQIGFDKMVAEFKQRSKSVDHDSGMPMSPGLNAEETSFSANHDPESI
uniref:TRPM SLOG domain-containing protein n=1 Tax=Plectus sambesii TaxID=2011161 RepID=A0A914VQG5_9BILA